MIWSDFALVFGRALRLRCPVCGRGQMFRTWFGMYDRCPACGHRFEREEGYFTGAMAVNLVITESVVALIVLPLAALQFSLVPLISLCVVLPILLPLLGFRHSRSLWIAIDLLLHPLDA
jgi:uncharacterized protein (DUF983 family)